jgi:hypothetical protein
MKNPYDGTHDWSAVDSCLQTSVDTCLKCGLLRLRTLSNVFYFTQLVEPFTGCRWRMRDVVDGLDQEGQEHGTTDANAINADRASLGDAGTETAPPASAAGKQAEPSEKL